MRYLRLVPLVLLLSSCRAYVNHPGSASTFDSQCYDALYTADQTIQTVKADIANNTLPVSAKPYVNKLIASYNLADSAWLTYHDMALRGQDVASQMLAVQNDLSQLATDIAAMKSNSGGLVK